MTATVGMSKDDLKSAIIEAINAAAYGSSNSYKSSRTKTKNKTKNPFGDIDKSSKETADTLKYLKKKLQDTYKTTEELNKQYEQISQNKKEESKALTEYRKEIGDRIKWGTKLTAETKSGVLQFGTLSQRIKAFTTNIPHDTFDKFSSKMLGETGKASSSIKMLAGSSKVALIGLSVLGAIAGSVAATLMNSLESYKVLNDSGVYLGTSLVGLATAAATLNMNLQEYSDLARNFPRLMNSVGTSFSATSREVSKGLNNYGLSIKEGAEYFAEYLDQSRLLGMTERINSITTQRNFKNLIATTDELSVAFGAAKSQVKEQVSKTFNDPFIKAAFRNMPESMRENIRASFASAMTYFSAAAPGVADMISDMFGSAVPQMSQSFQTLAQAGMGDAAAVMADYTRKLKAGTATEDDRQRMLVKLSKADTSRLAIMAKSGNSAAQQMLEQVLSAKEGIEAYNKLSKEEQEKRRKNLQIQAAINNTLDEFRTIGNKFIVGLMDAFGTDESKEALKSFVSVIANAASTIGQIIGESLLAISKVFSGIESIGDKVGESFGDLAKHTFLVVGSLVAIVSSLKLFKSVVGTISGALKGVTGALGKKLLPTSASSAIPSAVSSSTSVAPAVTEAGKGFSNFSKNVGQGLSSLSKSIGESFKSLGSGLGSSIQSLSKGIGGSIKSLGSGISNALGSIGSGVGKGISGILGGLGKGLSAFPPQAVQGALYISGAMIALSAGVKASAFILNMGGEDELKQLSSGFTSFNDIDGMNLITVGGGLIALGAGLTAFGAGSVLGAIGNLVGGIFDGLNSFFGNTSIFDKIEEFGRRQFPVDQIISNANALSAYGKALSYFSAGSAASGTGGLVEHISSSLTSLFGGDDVLTKLKKFGEMKLNIEGISANARAMNEYARAMMATGNIDIESAAGVMSSASTPATKPSRRKKEVRLQGTYNRYELMQKDPKLYEEMENREKELTKEYQQSYEEKGRRLSPKFIELKVERDLLHEYADRINESGAGKITVQEKDKETGTWVNATEPNKPVDKTPAGSWANRSIEKDTTAQDDQERIRRERESINQEINKVTNNITPEMAELLMTLLAEIVSNTKSTASNTGQFIKGINKMAGIM